MSEGSPTMLAVRQGGAEAGQVEVGPVPRPRRGDGEVLVRLEAAAINPFDLSVVLGHDGPTALRHIPGRDMAGIVEEGPREQVGQAVWATGGDLGTRRDGFQAEYVVLPTEGVRPRPSRLSPEAAGSVGVAFTTAWYALVETGGLRLGDRVLVTGAAGAVGSAGLQIARWKGLEEIVALVLDEAEAETAVGYGATTSITDPSQLSDLDEARRPTLCFDTVGNPVLSDVVDAMGYEGRIVNISTTGDGRVTFDLRRFYRRHLTLRGIGTGAYDVVQDADVLERLGPGFESGSLQPPRIAATFPLARAAEAYERMAVRPPGKVVLTMHPSG